MSKLTLFELFQDARILKPKLEPFFKLILKSTCFLLNWVPEEETGVLERHPGLAVVRKDRAAGGVVLANLLALLLARDVVHDAQDIVQFASKSWMAVQWKNSGFGLKNHLSFLA